MAPRYTDDDVARWYARYQQGLTLKEVAREFGVAQPTIQGAFLRRGLPRRLPHRWRSDAGEPWWVDTVALPAEKPPDVPDRHWRLLLARRAGRTQADIARDLGVTRQRVAQLEDRALALLTRRRATRDDAAPAEDTGSPPRARPADQPDASTGGEH